MARLKECCCGCSVRTGTLIVLWIDAAFSTIMAMISLAAAYGTPAAIDLFKFMAQYSYNAAKFFYHQSKSFGGDANIDDFESVLKASQNIDPKIQQLAKLLGNLLFYWNFFLILITILGIVAVHRKQHYWLMPFVIINTTETVIYLIIVVLACCKISLPSIWLTLFPSLITIALKVYCTSVVYSHLAELQSYNSKKRGPGNKDVEYGNDTTVKSPLNY